MEKRPDLQKALDLYRTLSLHQLGQLASERLDQCCKSSFRSYIVDRNINYTDICTCKCKFCAFNKSQNDGYILPLSKLYDKISELTKIGGKQILLQGGLNPSLSLDWQCKMLRSIKADFPFLHIHAYSPPEILFFASQSGKSVENIISSLIEAGLSTIPGGGAEILVDEIRKQISPAKCSADQWLSVMAVAHRLGVFTTATMMFGHLESIENRIEHLARLRDLQDDSLARGKGFFTSFTAWPFQPGNSPLTKNPRLKLASPNEYLRTIALARIYLDNFKNIQSSWVTMGADIGQLSLFFGCNDLGSIMMEENVVASAGTRYSMSEQDLINVIKAAGFVPVARESCIY